VILLAVAALLSQQVVKIEKIPSPSLPPQQDAASIKIEAAEVDFPGRKRPKAVRSAIGCGKE
jgi:hypothetical protein